MIRLFGWLALLARHEMTVSGATPAASTSTSSGGGY